MGNNISSNHSTSSIKKARGRRVSSSSQSTNHHETISSNKKLGKRPLAAIRSNQSMSNAIVKEDNVVITPAETTTNEEENTLPALNRLSPHYKRIKTSSQRNSRLLSTTPKDFRYSSTISASGFSSTIGDPLHFSMIADSTITDITNASNFSVNSFLDKIGEDTTMTSRYTMHIPDSDYHQTQQLPSIENVTTTDDILNLLTQHPNDTYDLLTAIYGSDKMKQNTLDLQREAFLAVETWSLRPTDHIAKTIVACCQLCGWGTAKDTKKGFQSLQSLANKGTWEAYYYLGQCYHYGVDNESTDHEQAIFWYKKVIQEEQNSVRAQYYVAEAQFRIAAIRFASGSVMNNESILLESIHYLKASANAGNR